MEVLNKKNGYGELYGIYIIILIVIFPLVFILSENIALWRAIMIGIIISIIMIVFIIYYSFYYLIIDNEFVYVKYVYRKKEYKINCSDIYEISRYIVAKRSIFTYIIKIEYMLNGVECEKILTIDTFCYKKLKEILKQNVDCIQNL